MLKIGHEYKVNHSRKGGFSMRITEDSDIWVTGVITDGVSRGIRDYNTREKGEEITVRKAFCGFELVEEL